MRNTATSPAMVALPAAPLNASPVPWLTSIHSAPHRGPWGDSRYPGNCSGYLIRDLLQYFQPTSVFDPMSGSGTCEDVCRDLDIRCLSADVRHGFDAGSPKCYTNIGPKDFIWMHPPYWRMKKYGDDPRCLSNAPTAAEFYLRLRAVIVNCYNVLADSGKLAILMGDYFDPTLHKIIPCVHMTKDICLNAGLWPACTDIIRFQHNNTSSKKHYASRFIPGLHDVCMVFEKQK